MGFPLSTTFGVGWLIFGWLFMILFWILIILALAWLIRNLVGKGSDSNSDLTALEILKKRYAQGKISKEQFEKIKREIS